MAAPTTRNPQGRCVALLCFGILVSIGIGPGVSAAIFFDDFGQGQGVAGIMNIPGSTVGATAQPGEPPHFAEPAQHSVWVKWSPVLTATYTIQVTSNDFDTVLAVYLGNTWLQPVATNDDISFQTTASSVTFRAYAGEVFNIAVDGVGGAQGRFEMTIAYAGPVMAAWSTSDLKGKPVSSQQFSNRFLIFDFWETTCGACVAEIYQLFRLQQALAPVGFSFVGVALDADPQTVQNFVQEYPFPYSTIMNSPSASYNLNGPEPIGPPTKFLVDPERRVVTRFVGAAPDPANTYSYYLDALAPIVRNSSIPKLQIERQGDNLLASWSDSLYPAGFRLEWTSQISGAGWSFAPGPVYTNNARVYMVVPAAGDSGRFFRLRNPTQ